MKLKGIVCPFCRGTKWKVYYNRPTSDGTILRVRICDKCGGRASTKEQLMGVPSRKVPHMEP